MLVLAFELLALLTLLIALAVMLANRNVIFTFLKESTAKFVMANGILAEVLLYHSQWNFVGVQDENRKRKKSSFDKWQLGLPHNPRIIPRWLKYSPLAGIRVMGPPTSTLHQWEERWQELTEEKTANGMLKISLVEQKVLQTELPIRLESLLLWYVNVETQDGMSADIITLVIFRPLNPAKMIFSPDNWRKALRAKIEVVLRTYAGSHTYQHLINKRESTDKDLNILSKTERDWLEEEVGISIEEIRIANINPSSERERLLTQLQFAAREQAKAFGEIGKAVIELGDIGTIVIQHDILKKAAEAGGTFNFVGNSGKGAKSPILFTMPGT